MFTKLTKYVDNVEQFEFNNKFVAEGFTFQQFKTYETSIMKSCTGTGKKTANIRIINSKLYPLCPEFHYVTTNEELQRDRN